MQYRQCHDDSSTQDAAARNKQCRQDHDQATSPKYAILNVSGWQDTSDSDMGSIGPPACTSKSEVDPVQENFFLKKPIVFTNRHYQLHRKS